MRTVRAKCIPGGNLIKDAANAVSADGTARQKPGRVTVRHFCDWLDARVCDYLGQRYAYV